MSLEMFKTNVEICVRMAAIVKTPEVRQQWNELAAHWHSKWEACNKQQPQAAAREIIKQVSAPIVMKAQAAQPEAKSDGIPTIKHPLILVPKVVPPPAPHPEQRTLDAIWDEFRRFSDKSARTPATPPSVRRKSFPAPALIG